MDYILELDRKRAVELIDRFSRFIVEKRLGAAAIMTIESLKPLAGLSSHALHAISPFMEVFFKPKDIQELALILDNREYIDLLIKRVDELDEEMYREERLKNRALRAKKRKNRAEKIKKVLKKINIFNK